MGTEYVRGQVIMAHPGLMRVTLRFRLPPLIHGSRSSLLVDWYLCAEIRVMEHQGPMWINLFFRLPP